MNTHSPVRSPVLRRILRPAGFVLLFLGVLWGVPALTQDRLLYLPTPAPLEAVLAHAERQQLAPWPDAARYRGLLREPVGAARGTLVLFHGNAGHALHRAWYADVLAPMGFRVLLAEYPGYGPRAGEVGEASFAPDAAETITQLRRAFPGPLIVAGESLGAGVAAAALPRLDSPPDGLLLMTPWSRLVDLARHHYPWIPVRWLLRDRYDSIAHLSGYTGPTVVLVAEADRIVPPKFARALHAALPGPKRLWQVQAGHNDWLMAVHKDDWRENLDFLLGPVP